MRKKSQVTIIIIVVIIGIIITSMFLSSNNKSQLAILQESDDVNLKEIIPVKVFVEEAMEDLLIEGIFLIGKQGGKIYNSTWPDCLEENPDYTEDHRMCDQQGNYSYNYPLYLEDSPYFHKRIAVGINNSRVDGGEKITQSSVEPLEQPFAYPHINKYLGTHYLFGLNEPLAPITYESGERAIEYQLSRWIENHLSLDFSEFEIRGFDIPLPENKSEVKVEINEQFITVHMNYDLVVHKSTITYYVDEFYIQIDSSFRPFYNYINSVIRDDVSTLENIISIAPLEIDSEEISEIRRIESDPLNYEYDIINITLIDTDFRIKYNYDEKFLNFYFIRENRAPDASTVYYESKPTYVGDTITWYCPNYYTNGVWFDPDEDDQYEEVFPFANPQWYQWYSRGDKLVTELNPPDGIDGFKGCPYVDEIDYRNEFDLKENGPDWEAKLKLCGNAQLEVFDITSPEDVGDIIILKVGDQQEFPTNGKIYAPKIYPESPVLEEGFGRLNDILTFQPVHCEKGNVDSCNGGNACGDDGFWRFNKPPEPKMEEEFCIERCVVREEYCANPCPSPPGGCCDTTQSCRSTNPPRCSKTKIMTRHVNEKGECVYFNDEIRKGSVWEECNSWPDADNCDNTPSPLCFVGDDETKPLSQSPTDNSIAKPVCCADEDGLCQDIGIPASESECGEFTNWTYVSDSQFCNRVSECNLGMCYIRGKPQPNEKSFYECAALCKESGECECSDLSTCQGDFNWIS